MEKIVIYCKSYINDLSRAKILAESIEKYNTDNIPFYISCPQSDLDIFKKTLPSFVNFIADEDIVKKTYTQDHNTQQIIKSQFWKTIDTCNYVCIDSDSYFIKPFYIDDFIADGDTPYTVIHQQKNLFQWSSRYDRELGFNPQEGYNTIREKIGNIFGRNFKVNYDFGPTPAIWSSDVWKALEENYIVPNNLKFENLIEYVASELTWYGEALLAFKPIDLYPIEPLFMVFHYPLQLKQFYEQQYTERDIAKCYMGIIMTSNFNAPLRYEL